MDDEVDEKIDSMLDEFTGSDFEVQSFGSDKNKNVESVQFVIKTPVIAIEKEEVEEYVEEESLTVWQKILKLFKLY